LRAPADKKPEARRNERGERRRFLTLARARNDNSAGAGMFEK
jgi:hypothetical protein